MNRPREFPRRPPDVSGLSDQELVALARENREEGFRGLTRRYEPAVKARIYDLVRDDGVTDEVAATTWDKAFAALHKYTPRNFPGWVLRIAYNAAIDELRKKWLDTVPLDTAVDTGPRARGSEALAAPVYGRAASKEARLSARVFEVHEALTALPRNQHRCIYLHYFEDLSCKQIAEFLDMPVGTVKSHLLRGKENMERILGPKYQLLFSDSASGDPFYTPPADTPPADPI